ncbi:MAG: ATP-binding protein [Nitrospinae bacterium]|nr:ATP-binding protein [Nitrospinota bacterium]
MAALAMNHELSNDALLLKELAELLLRVAESEASPEAQKAVKILEDYRNRFEAYRRLFSPLADSEEREAVQRLSAQAVVSQVVRALRPRLSGVVFQQSSIPRDLRFPLGAFAEWSAIVQNILFNAWNAMLDTDRRIVKFEGSTSTARRQYLRVSDTGVGLTMPPEDAIILFEAFERQASISSANRSIAIGGQGLGLAIVRMIALSRNAEVAFVNPPPGFSTSIQLSWKG